MRSTRHSARFDARAADALALVLLTACAAVAWCTAYHRWTWTEWQVPLRYVHDDLWIFGTVKAHAEGALGVFGSKIVPRLNAPFTANWNDFPISEDFMLHLVGVGARAVGVFAATNLAFFLSSILAGWSFYIAGRWLGYERALCAAGAVAFALPSLLFQRGIGHLLLASYWYIPIFLAALEKIRDSRRTIANGRWAVVGAVFGIFVGLQATEYYAWMTGQLLVLGILGLLIKHQYRRALVLFTWGCGLVVATLAGECDTLLYALHHGANHGALDRSVASLSLDALQLPSLFLPPLNYRVAAWADWSNVHFYHSNVLFGEGSTPYLGLLGIAGLAILTFLGIRAFLAPRQRRIPTSWLQVLWVCAYSLPGGVAACLGVFGFILIRDTNRYSIYILALALLFLVRGLSRWCPRRLMLPLAIGLAAIAVLDQTPAPLSAAAVTGLKTQVDSDEQLVRDLERRLGPGAMVFELPVVAFPEMPPVHEMTDYEQLIPYIHSKHLRFTYGTVKGRGSEQWQHVAAALGPDQMVNQLQREGFAAIWINRRGYPDRAETLVRALRPGRTVLESARGDLAAIILQPSGHDLPPALSARLGSGMYGWETQAKGGSYWSWSRQQSELELFNAADTTTVAHLQFVLNSLRPQQVAVDARGIHRDFDLRAKGPVEVFLDLPLPPGRTTVEFSAARAAERPSNGDGRKIAFGIFNAKLNGLRP
jgi:hypothetical protein